MAKIIRISPRTQELGSPLGDNQQACLWVQSYLSKLLAILTKSFLNAVIEGDGEGFLIPSPYVNPSPSGFACHLSPRGEANGRMISAPTV